MKLLGSWVKGCASFSPCSFGACCGGGGWVSCMLRSICCDAKFGSCLSRMATRRKSLRWLKLPTLPEACGLERLPSHLPLKLHRSLTPTFSRGIFLTHHWHLRESIRIKHTQPAPGCQESPLNLRLQRQVHFYELPTQLLLQLRDFLLQLDSLLASVPGLLPKPCAKVLRALMFIGSCAGVLKRIPSFQLPYKDFFYATKRRRIPTSESV